MAVARIEAGVDARADADLEKTIAGRDAHVFDRHEPAVMKRRTEPQVVPAGLLLVDAFDEIGFDGGHRQRSGRRVGSEIIVLTVEDHAWWPPKRAAVRVLPMGCAWSADSEADR